MHRFATRLLAAALLALVVPVRTPAVDLADGKLNVGGNASWAFEKTNANTYLAADKGGEWATAMFDLIATAKPTENIVLTGQIGLERDGAELEWAFGEYRFSDLLRVRAGKVKQPFGNYGELQFVGIARPFFGLATSVYGPANVLATSYSGVGVTGEWLGESGFGVQYDLYGGALSLDLYEPFFDYPRDPATFTGTEIVTEEVENLVGGRLSLSTPWEVTLRVSGFGGKGQRDGELVTTRVVGASLFHRGERLWASVEAFESVEAEETQVSAYAELAYFVTGKVQVAARYERCRMTLDDPLLAHVPAGLLGHDEAAIGLNWWFTPQVVAKVSVHEAWGKRFVSPGEDPLANPADRTLMFVGGTQFTF